MKQRSKKDIIELIESTDFRCRASEGGTLSTESRTKSKKQRYEEALIRLKELRERYDGFKNQECKSALKIINESIPETKELIDYLEPKINDVELSDTAKSYIQQWVKELFSGKQKQIKSKYLKRGIDAEPAAIERVGRYYGVKLEKNELHFHNEYFQGTFDTIIPNRLVVDTKVSWDIFTFPTFDEVINSDYFLQLQIYMNLTDTPRAALCYCLENGTPEQIERLAWEIANTKLKEEPDIEDWDEAEALLSYDHLPDEMRIKVYEFDYDHSVIEQLQKKVVAARKYIKDELIPLIK
jgi:hypothetical protein